MNKINFIILSLKIILSFLKEITYGTNSTLEEVRESIKELAYSYYMREKNIQYNSHKSLGWFSPEEATEQNFNYIICSGLTRNIYRELLNITIPYSTQNLLSYSYNNIGNPEVIAYSYINNNNIPEMKIYDANEENKYKIIPNPSIKDIIPLVQIGDILTYSGHTKIVYDIETDNNGQVIDVIIMQSFQGPGKSYVETKIGKDLSFLFLNKKLNSNFEEGLEEGSLSLTRLSTFSNWVNINNITKRNLEYSILRFINKDSKGNAILKYKTIYQKQPNAFLNNDIIKLPNKNIDRMHFKHLYIAKIVNKNNNNIVELGDILNYKIIIKNLSKKDYDNDLIVNEYLSQYVNYEIHYESKNIIFFIYDKENKKLIWNIGKLKKDEEIIINYFVKITSGKPKDIIESIGFVNYIPSSIIRNKIGINLNQKNQNLIEKNYEKLKKKYNGKKLINEIYKNSFDIDIKFDEFDITNLINNSILNSTSEDTINLNKNNSFYDAILNKYWSSLTTIEYQYIKGKKDEKVFDLKTFREYNNNERRGDFIFLQTFKTGDILIYKNKDDIIYKVDNNTLITNYITYEDGEYAYIYIEGKGFVGVNIGDDGIENTKDDRNEFNANYYKINNLTLYQYAVNTSDELLEIVNMQTLFGKDYYAILRPSLCFNFENKNSNFSLLLFIFYIVLFIFIICGIFILWKYIKMKKVGKEFNFKNLKEELLI